MPRIILKRIALLLAVAGGLFAFNANCPLDATSAIWTGKTTVDQATAKILYEHKCVRGHVFWTLAP